MGNLSDKVKVDGTTPSDVPTPVLKLNSKETGTVVTAGFSGIETFRGTGTTFRFGFRESDDKLVAGSGVDSSLYDVVVVSVAGVAAVDISGNAATVTNGVYLSGNQTIAGTKTFSSTIAGSINGNAATVTNGVYTTGNQTIGGNKTFSGFTAFGTGNVALKVKRLVVPTYTGTTATSLSTAHGLSADKIVSVTGTYQTDATARQSIPGVVYDSNEIANRQIRVSWDGTNVVANKYLDSGGLGTQAFLNSTSITFLVFYIA